MDMNFERAFKQVSAFNKRHKLLSGGERVLLAVSGGADSTLLLRFFLRFGSSLDLTLAAGHVNHSLRGDEALADEQFCSGLASSAGIPFFSSSLGAGELARQAGGSIEEAARIRRYRELGRFAAEWNADILATGHHGGDLAETLLLNLLRGTSLTGLGGIRPLSPAPESELPLIRPMLCLSGEEVVETVREMKLEHREDSTNADTRFRRNRIRHLLLPFLAEKFGAGAERILARSALLASEGAAVLRELAGADLESATTRLRGASARELDLGFLRPLGRGRIKLVLHAAMTEALGGAADIEAAHLEQAADLALREGGSGELTLTGGVRLVREYDRLFIEKAAAVLPSSGKSGTEQDSMADDDPVVIAGPGDFSTYAGKLTVSRHVAPVDFRPPGEPDPGRLLVPSRSISFPCTFRRVKSGDVFEPFGLGGHKKVRRLLLDRKVPPGRRKDASVLEDGRGIFWVVGYARDVRVKLPSPCDSYYQFICRPGDFV